jgi:hypothetical protein
VSHPMPSRVSQRNTRILSMLECSGRGLRQLLEMLVEAGAQHAPLGLIGACAREDDEIPGRQRAQLTKRLARDTLDLVAVHCAFRNSTRDGQTEASGAAAARARENGKEAIARARGLGEYAPELRRRVQSLVGREPCRVGKQRRAKTQPVKA